MLFSSISFLYYFLPVTLILYYVAPKSVKNLVLLMVSLLFYGWGEPSYIFVMAASVTMGYVTGILLEKTEKNIIRRGLLIFSLAISLGLLGYFKYANFFIRNFNSVAGLDISLLNIALPIGISFYTFQLISYVIDVYFKAVKAQKNFITLATYITMFPQLIAGPIVRYADIEKQLNKRSCDYNKTAYGIRRFVLGLSKKILIANVLGEFCNIFYSSDDKSILFYWAYAIAISLQIYFDFSGYSDMAIGLGSLLGFCFMENFNYPFISRSATEFWRRWHMSLGTWFRDYVYIPLGGSRKGKYRLLINIFIVWFLTGFWHGAEWTFIVWGIYFAILLVAEKLFLLRILEKHRLLSHMYLLPVCIFSFIIFSSATLSDAFFTLKKMFGCDEIKLISDSTVYYLKSFGTVFLISFAGATPLPKKIIHQINKHVVGAKILAVLEPVTIIILLLVCTGYLIDGSFNPFLYFRF